MRELTTIETNAVNGGSLFGVAETLADFAYNGLRGLGRGIGLTIGGFVPLPFVNNIASSLFGAIGESVGTFGGRIASDLIKTWIII